MPDDSLLLRPAVPADAAALAALGARTFAETFGHSTSPANLADFLAATYSPERQTAELADAALHVIVAERAGEPGPLAFAMLRAGAAPPCVTGPAPVELARLYARADVVGRGVGARLMAECRRVARERGFRTLWLGVWEHNERALAFYARHGFRDVGAHTFHVGADAQTDRLMVAAL